MTHATFRKLEPRWYARTTPKWIAIRFVVFGGSGFLIGATLSHFGLIP